MVSDKFISKYMRLAKQIADDNDACYSRKIGVVIVDPETNSLVATGYNGPPAGTPHCDTSKFLFEFFWPQLTDEEKETYIKKSGFSISWEMGRARPNLENFRRKCTDVNTGCKTCPRRLVNAGPGERAELCSCNHAERNALNKLQRSAYGLVMFCWCGVPCIQCAGSIITSGISECHCTIEEQDYHSVSRWLFEQSKTKLVEHEKENFIF